MEKRYPIGQFTQTRFPFWGLGKGSWWCDPLVMLHNVYTGEMFYLSLAKIVVGFHSHFSFTLLLLLLNAVESVVIGMWVYSGIIEFTRICLYSLHLFSHIIELRTSWCRDGFQNTPIANCGSILPSCPSDIANQPFYQVSSVQNVFYYCHCASKLI